QDEVAQIELFGEGVQVRGEGLPRVRLRIGPRAVAVSTQIQREDVMVSREPRRDEIVPVRVRRPAVYAQHPPASGGAVIQEVELDAVRFEETARAGCRLKVGHCLDPERVAGDK